MRRNPVKAGWKLITRWRQRWRPQATRAASCGAKRPGAAWVASKSTRPNLGRWRRRRRRRRRRTGKPDSGTKVEENRWWMALDRYNRPRVRHYDRPVRERDLGIFFLIFLFFFFFFFSFFSVPTGRFIGRTLPNSTGLFSSVYITFIVFFVIFFVIFFFATFPSCYWALGRFFSLGHHVCAMAQVRRRRGACDADEEEFLLRSNRSGVQKKKRINNHNQNKNPPKERRWRRKCQKKKTRREGNGRKVKVKSDPKRNHKKETKKKNEKRKTKEKLSKGPTAAALAKKTPGPRQKLADKSAPLGGRSRRNERLLWHSGTFHRVFP